jgi:pyruvate dehydrogenase (quinone)
MIGLGGILVDSPDQLQPAWQAALSADRPTVIEVMTDPDFAPFPPHLTLAQARGFMRAMAKGDKRLGSVIRDTASQLISEIRG